MRALLFDLDGTLVDSAIDIASALSSVRRARGGQAIDADQVRPWISLGAERLVGEALGALAGVPIDDLAAFRVALGCLPADPATIFPGVADALATLQQAGRSMAVVTNKPEGLSRVLLDGLGLSRFFGSVVGGDTTPVGKPDTAPLLRAAADLGWELDRTVMIGDSMIDAEAAHRACIPFILYEGGYDSIGCLSTTERFGRFVDLPPLLNRLGY